MDSWGFAVSDSLLLPCDGLLFRFLQHFFFLNQLFYIFGSKIFGNFSLSWETLQISIFFIQKKEEKSLEFPAVKKCQLLM